MQLRSISNGLGSQSMKLLIMAAHREIDATVSITADTGSELDRLWSNGRRTTAQVYFEEVVSPYAEAHGIAAYFVRTVDKYKKPFKSLVDNVREEVARGRFNNIRMPLYGSRGGQLRQVCTNKWKIRAIRQQARRLGAKKLLTYQGIHFGEADRRVKGRYLRDEGKWSIYQDTVIIKGKEKDEKWCEHTYPLVDLKMVREDAVECVKREGLPYLISSECDPCPHQDWARWQRHTPESIAESAELEASFGGRFFLTPERIPLIDALELMREKKATTPDADFGCGNGYCGI